MSVEYTIQTNGTLIDDELGGVLQGATTSWSASASTARRAMHDAYRVDKGGAPTFDRVMRGLETLKQHGVEFNILTTLHHANADHPRRGLPLPARRARRALHPVHPHHRAPADADRSTCRSTSSSCHRAWPRRRPGSPGGIGRCTGRRASLVTDRSVTAEQYGAFLIGVFEEWVRRDIGDGLRPDVRRRAGQLARRAVRPVHPFRRPAATALAMEHNGDLYSLRPLRRAGLQARQHHRDADDRAGRLAAAAQVRPGQVRHAAAATASSATCASPATAAAPRIASSARRTASPG